jgi:hypothetical protein
MRFVVSLGLSLALFARPAGARADEPDPVVGVASGAGIQTLGFAIGAMLLGTSHRAASQDNAGFLTIEAGLALAPLVAHGAVGEWGRGAAFTAIPAGTMAATGVFLAYEPGAVENGPIEQQRVLWSLLGAGILSSFAGVVDAAFARQRSVIVTPTLGAGSAGIAVMGVL